MTGVLAGSLVLGLVLGLHEWSEARAACRQDADCGTGRKCVTGKGPCAEPVGLEATCTVFRCVAATKPPRPERFDHGWAELTCSPDGAGYLAVTYVWQGDSRAPKWVLYFALSADDISQAQAGRRVSVDLVQPVAATFHEVSAACDPAPRAPCAAIRVRDAEIESISLALQPDQRPGVVNSRAEIDLRLKGTRSSLAGEMSLDVMPAAIRLTDLKCRHGSGLLAPPVAPGESQPRAGPIESTASDQGDGGGRVLCRVGSIAVID